MRAKMNGSCRLPGYSGGRTCVSAGACPASSRAGRSGRRTSGGKRYQLFLPVDLDGARSISGQGKSSGDTVGEVDEILFLSIWVYVGGPRSTGGHNVLEPDRSGYPVVFGRT